MHTLPRRRDTVLGNSKRAWQRLGSLTRGANLICWTVAGLGRM
ncbi:hypothetical protein DB31_5823 [Hyalangium minutum]|uniref:Uncharacterized protein n=1 Tax=Hyalangium minutum TaxID=394096 RepID=A0A085WSW8_9BACT|nr:hypothetical protein DB31_5823 [Hyalangium minutum]